MSFKGIAVQMYTLREECEKDFTGTLEKVAELGFDGVELAGYGGLSAKELSRVLNELGLKTAAAHVPLDSLENDLENVLSYQKELGNRHIVCPVLPRDRHAKSDYQDLIATLNKAGQRAREEGITLSYHNHDFELFPFDDGVKPLERILEETNPEWVKAEFDVYWLQKAGENPLDWVSRYQNRMPLIHLKDMTTDGEEFFAELGTGGVDIPAILEAISSSSVEWWVIEQDQSRKSPFESIKQSIDYLKNTVASN
ncbi:sugar phosphate isomerase/epimerase family protein [Jeotgalibacillus proteolyticus]|uniref:Sugar phosphate isomerase/epimerase n=1 Tax=Jeotgalibacillus proteolyticus TaxID=2082395 RepID=A0A2S5GCT8_9BACL|nr:sugar phosphate isomerase/epimerase [Jeotgalibacillus proteolyticus]PPA70820.1 sugar phosphate isomerase/epimerase [Jeotgalibacillus proteolyticus]